ncbi:MAG: phage holin family protein, partial [Tissierellia bacterium]|nr:phage holin family protein [Tissierellia bacterium]
LGSYLVNEIRSILENLVKLGVNVPSFMVKGLQITSDLIENAADGKLPKENAGND